MNDARLVPAHLAHLRLRSLAPSSIDKRRIALQLFARWLEDDGKTLTSCSFVDVESFLETRHGRGGGPLGDRARYGWISHLSQFYRWAIDYELADRDPTTRVIRPKMRRLLPRPMADDDLRRALHLAPPLMHVWLTLMAFAGLRVSEVAGLTSEDVLADQELLWIVGKGGVERTVPIHQRVARVLQTRPSHGRIFVQASGRPFTGANVSRQTSLYLESIDVHAVPHQARHWFGTQLYAECRDLRVVQEVMGHASPVTTAGYAAFCRAEAKRAVRGLELGEVAPHCQLELRFDLEVDDVA